MCLFLSLIFSNLSLFLHNIPGLRSYIQGKIDADDKRELNAAGQEKEVKVFHLKYPSEKYKTERTEISSDH